MTGPLADLRVIELASIGPGPHAAMVLADLGARVTRVARPDDAEAARRIHHTLRRRRTTEIDLKQPDGRARVLDLVEEADVLLEGMRPGVTERLGLGPTDCLDRNPALVYGRMTGWGQHGPLAQRAGHDINYLALSGILSLLGPRDRPSPPANLLGDYGGGSMVLLVGVLAALWERSRTGLGQVVDAAMVDGVPLLAQLLLEGMATGSWIQQREANLLDGAAPFYRTYACADGKFIAVGALEPQFYALLLNGLALTPSTLPDQYDRSAWPRLTRVLGARFASRSRDEWADHFAATDACVTPVLDVFEASTHPHIAARRSLTAIPGGLTATGAPRFARPGTTEEQL